MAFQAKKEIEYMYLFQSNQLGANSHGNSNSKWS